MCDAGKYSDKRNSLSCSLCPSGTTTIKAGAQSKDECGSMYLYDKLYILMLVKFKYFTQYFDESYVSDVVQNIAVSAISEDD